MTSQLSSTVERCCCSGGSVPVPVTSTGLSIFLTVLSVLMTALPLTSMVKRASMPQKRLFMSSACSRNRS